MSAWSRLSIRWKLQIAFFAVTMATTLYNRFIEMRDLRSMLDLAEREGVNQATMTVLYQRYDEVFGAAIWESAFEFVIQFGLIAILAALMVRPILALIRSLKAVEKGDLTRSVKVTSDDEIGQLQRQFNNMLDQLNGLIASIHHSSLHMGQSAYQIAAVSREIEEISNAQEARSSEVNNAMDSLHQASEQVRELSGSTLEKALETESHGRDGVESVQQTLERMQAIGEGVNKASSEAEELQNAAGTIDEIVETIRSISDQTNLLALNAAIEAARAGESGRGFAVVADEVRALAARTGQSAEEVSRIVETLIGRVETVAGVMRHVVSQMEENREGSERTIAIIESMGRDISETAELNQRISQASEDQIQGLDDVRDTLQTLFGTLRENAQKIGNTANIGDALFSLNGDLQGQLKGMTYREVNAADNPPPGVHERRAAPRVPGHLLVTAEVDGERLEGMSRDISMTGMQLLLKHRLGEGQKLRLGIRLPTEDTHDFQHQDVCTLQGNIVRMQEQDNRYQYGIHFDALNHSEKKALERCIDFFNRAKKVA
ncbi:methyl-accepting chemotaxis protein [Marinobacteraceae bacterium S3BR75-40.1]